MSDSAGNIDRRWITQFTNYSFLLFVVSLGFPQIPIRLLGQEVHSTDLLFLLTGALWLASVAFGGRQLRWHAYSFALVAYVAAMTISAVFSVDRATSFARLPAEIYLICLAVLSFNIIDSLSLVKRTVWAWLAGTSIAIIIGMATIVIFYFDPGAPLLEYVTYHYGSVPVGNYPRLTAGFVSASMLCNYLNVGIVFALLALTEKWGPHKLAVILCLIIAITAAFTFSIGLGGLALAIGVWILLSMHVEKRLKMTAFALGCLVAIFFLVVSLFALAPYPGAQVVLSVPCLNIDLMPSARMLVWADAMRTFLSHPITGLGLGEPVANVVFTNTDGSLSLLTDAHNSFLSVAAQNGVIGLTAFMAIVFVIMKRWSRDIVSNTSITILGALGLAFTCSFVYQGLTGSFEDARHLWVLLGIFLAGDRVGQTES